MTDTDAPTTPTAPTAPRAEQIEQFIGGYAAAFGTTLRSPVWHSPTEAGLDFQEVTFPSKDGVPLEGWYIPAAGSDKLIIANHPLWFSRSGLPAHLEPWKSMWAATGNDNEVDFIPDYKILHDAGYNVLAYDLRNLGQTGAANGGVISAGVYEARDVLGSLAYVRNRADLTHMTIGLFSRCMGANATMFAMRAEPAAFEGVRAMVAPQPLSPRVTMEQSLAAAGIPARYIDELEQRVRVHTGFRLDEMSPVQAARSVNVPTLLYQVRDDILTRPDDVQAVYDNIPVDKDLFWIEGSTRRWDGYRYFAKNPQRILGWFDRYLS
ncbi:alpha/beta hydrolase [Solwaraspora sp. WMMA2059]|uniref:alpha/beta hydrolase family protein n=1 Tax=Solwaraspora sp. WMMA2059 TaxID=3015160 RepID=UPI00248B85B7|nr:alpha/beta hydrolase [Solwaraspora sp. WMMA2059]WBB98024.1 alpha/beta hydrolase [Solwaraspora sp. WMMA2059]